MAAKTGRSQILSGFENLRPIVARSKLTGGSHEESHYFLYRALNRDIRGILMEIENFDMLADF